MWHLFKPTLMQTASTVLAATLGIAASAEVVQTAAESTVRLTAATPDLGVVKPMSEVSEMLQVTVGHSQLLTGHAPFGTIIVGDDTVAAASLGPGYSIILTGLMAGSTNLIVLDEHLEPLLTTRINVVPVAGALRSTVTVTKGIQVREVYECRNTSCQRLAEADQQREFPYVPAANPETAEAEKPAAE